MKYHLIANMYIANFVHKLTTKPA